MQEVFQLIDADYVQINAHPTIRLFGKNKEGKTVCALFDGYFPYFYFIPLVGREEVEGILKKRFQGLIKKVEEVEMYESMGFRKEKTKMLKVFLSDPSRVPEVREFLVKEKLASTTFEADILFKYRFLCDFDMYGMRWYRIEGKEIKTDVIKTDKIFLVDKIEEEKILENAPFKVLSLDIETTAKEGKPNPEKDQIIMISMAFSPSFNGKENLVLVAKPTNINGNTLAFKDEKSMLEEFKKIVLSYDPDFIVGYNINSFDIPFIHKRMKEYKIYPSLGRAEDKPLTSKKLENSYRNHILGRVIVDIYDIVKELSEKGFIRLKRYGLDDVSKLLLGEGKVDIRHGEIGKIWEKNNVNEIQKLIEYSRKDAILTLRIFLEKRLIDKYIELSRVCGLLLQDVLDEGEAAKIESLLLREFNKRGFVLPNKPDKEEMLKRKEERETKGFKGAIVLEPKTGLYSTPIVYLDFKSLYPTIYISFNICPTTLVLESNRIEDVIVSPYGSKFVKPEIRKGIIPQIVDSLIKERDKIKKEMKKEKDEEKRLLLDSKQEALKRMANAFYGYTGYIRGRVYILDVANAITSYGRYLIETTKKLVESKNKEWEVIYGDTDSIMVKVNVSSLEEAFKEGREIERIINEFYQGKVTTKIEAVFKSFLIVSKKRYAGIAVEETESGYKEKMVMKGIETVRKDWCNLTEKVLSTVLDILLREANIQKAFEYVKETIKNVENGNVSTDDLTITKSISKNLDEYKGVQPHVELVKKLMKRSPEKVPIIGDRVSYVIVAGPDLVSKRAEDPEYVIQNKIKIDAKYYIENQILPPIERIFEAIGIKKSQLLSNGKQLLLSTLIQEKPKIAEERQYETFENFVCFNCGRIYLSPPFDGRCYDCKGEVGFHLNGERFRVVEKNI